MRGFEECTVRLQPYMTTRAMRNSDIAVVRERMSAASDRLSE
jgi:hypothetical protein